MVRWLNIVDSQYGLILACEVTGAGRPVNDTSERKDAKVHVIEKMDSIIPRYLLLIPFADRYYMEAGSEDYYDKWPSLKGADVEPALTAAFKIIKERFGLGPDQEA